MSSGLHGDIFRLLTLTPLALQSLKPCQIPPLIAIQGLSLPIPDPQEKDIRTNVIDPPYSEPSLWPLISSDISSKWRAHCCDPSNKVKSKQELFTGWNETFEMKRFNRILKERKHILPLCCAFVTEEIQSANVCSESKSEIKASNSPRKI